MIMHEICCHNTLFHLSCVFLPVCGQTLNYDGLLSAWFNDEDCPAFVRDASFLNR